MTTPRRAASSLSQQKRTSQANKFTSGFGSGGSALMGSLNVVALRSTAAALPTCRTKKKKKKCTISGLVTLASG